MICSSCRRTLLTRIRSLQQPQLSAASSWSSSPLPISSLRNLRYASTAAVPPTPAPTPAPASISIDGVNPTQSSRTQGISQPLSEPHTPSTSSAKPDGAAVKGEPKKPATIKVKSSVPGGQDLRGLGYTKAKPKVKAKEDDEYPEWLWTLLDEKKVGAGGESKADLSAMTKKQRARYDRKQERLLKTLPANVPLHEQSKDLTGPGDDAITSLQRRQEITKSARAARRKGIRESNFLKSM